MSEKLEPVKDERKRRIDELFADEPFLSATMKAKRLHEKLESGPVTFDVPTQSASGVALSKEWPERMESPIREVPIEAPPVNPLSLQRAREFLRIETYDGDPDDAAEKLERQNEILLRNLKDGVLSKWIQDMKAA